MPTYKYYCTFCKETITYFHGINEAPKRRCPSCNKLKLQRQISGGAGIHFKGSGFYINDYKKGEKNVDK